MHGCKLNGRAILVDLQTTSDPTKHVLEIIWNPILTWDEGITIDKSDIFLSISMMRISPNIEPRVKVVAMKLALELKETVRGSAENSLVVWQ